MTHEEIIKLARKAGIAVAKSEWVRPDYSAGAIRARGNT